jgi:hypothetical protein
MPLVFYRLLILSFNRKGRAHKKEEPFEKYLDEEIIIIFSLQLYISNAGVSIHVNAVI